MPHVHRRNRVTPSGMLEATAARGRFMGNRGDLHAPDGSIRRHHALKAWICCTLEPWRGQRVTFDRPGVYTPLFFLDEAVALTAGHRPCALCRRREYDAFKHAFRQAVDWPEREFLSAKAMDQRLHADRMDGKAQRRHRAVLGRLPDYTFLSMPNRPDEPYMLQGGMCRRWSHSGYDAPLRVDAETEVEVWTPRVVLDVLRAGYRPRSGWTVETA